MRLFPAAAVVALGLLLFSSVKATEPSVDKKNNNNEQEVVNKRALQDDGDDALPALPIAGTPCDICRLQGASLRTWDNETNTLLIPPPWTTAMSRPAPDFIAANNDDINSTTTCAEWSAIALRNFTARTADCLDLRDYLSEFCCDARNRTTAIPPLYECRTEAKKKGLGDDSSTYDQSVAPVLNGATLLDVGFQIEIYNVEIQDHGINGGSISATGELRLDWTDERLSFFDVMDEMDCSSYEVNRNIVWRPGLQAANDNNGGGGGDDDASDQLANLPDSTMVTVLADGRVRDSFWGMTTLKCQTLPGTASKECTMGWRDATGNRNVQYVARGGNLGTNSSGVVVRNLQSMPPSGYKLNDTASTISIEVDDELGPAVQQIQLILRFDPLEDDCNVCGDDPDTKLFPDNVPNYPWQWLDRYPQEEGKPWTCQELDDLMTTMTVGNDSCPVGRAYFEEACCDDVRTTFECENSIHNILSEDTNTVTPPEPSNKETDLFEDADELVDVFVSLDIAHVMGISVKSNSMEMLIGVELEWYDSRLAWDPFLGGCHRASFRASHDAELTEIWVPNFELINMAEGDISTLPDSHASVMYDGRVMWRRSGVLSATCELTGIQNFPFDTSGCFLEFGGTRNPLFHRIQYKAREVEYTKRVKDDGWNFQEYKLLTDKTQIITRTEELSGFSNDVIRFQFYFSRATSYYVNMFVILYVIFTLLSFGMFFIDYRIGERLGYGSSILFVIVAQDITMSDFTPVTQEFLWIYRLSLGSKIFVIAGIVQSIITLYVFNHEDDEDEDEHHGSRAAIADGKSEEEIRPFLENKDGPGSERQNSFKDVEEQQDADPLESRQETQDAPQPLVSSTDDVPTGPFSESLGKTAREGETSLHPDDNGPESAQEEKHTQRSLFGRVTRGLRDSKVLKSTAKSILGEHIIPHKQDSKKIRKMKKLLMIDKITAIAFVLGYGLFLLAMYLTL